jgi:hypothetical protein
VARDALFLAERIEGAREADVAASAEPRVHASAV